MLKPPRRLIQGKKAHGNVNLEMTQWLTVLTLPQAEVPHFLEVRPGGKRGWWACRILTAQSPLDLSTSQDIPGMATTVLKAPVSPGPRNISTSFNLVPHSGGTKNLEHPDPWPSPTTAVCTFHSPAVFYENKNVGLHLLHGKVLLYLLKIGGKLSKSHLSFLLVY